MWLRRPSNSSASIGTGSAELFPSHLLSARNYPVPRRNLVNRCLTRFNLSQYQGSDSTETFCLWISQPTVKARGEGHSKTGVKLSPVATFDGPCLSQGHDVLDGRDEDFPRLSQGYDSVCNSCLVLFAFSVSMSIAVSRRLHFSFSEKRAASNSLTLLRA